MKLVDAIDRLYYDLTLNELRMMNDNTLYPDISYNSLLYLDLISYKEDCTVSYLANALHISKPAVTSKVNELIKEGLVQKARDSADKRVYYLSVTPAVAEQYKQYDKRLNKAANLLKNNYTGEEVELFCRMLSTIRRIYMEEAD